MAHCFTCSLVFCTIELFLLAALNIHGQPFVPVVLCLKLHWPIQGLVVQRLKVLGGDASLTPPELGRLGFECEAASQQVALHQHHALQTGQDDSQSQGWTPTPHRTYMSIAASRSTGWRGSGAAYISAMALGSSLQDGANASNHVRITNIDRSKWPFSTTQWMFYIVFGLEYRDKKPSPANAVCVPIVFHIQLHKIVLADNPSTGMDDVVVQGASTMATGVSQQVTVPRDETRPSTSYAITEIMTLTPHLVVSSTMSVRPGVTTCMTPER